ncbi:GDP-L-fucose synthase [Desulfonauticus submarinus]|uniref:GDP-L-fucose synthase n=1 Tax=Desulfonauticus submarinus TaxID=206665 RepID=A0A1H0BGI2_9BACT|nr:GDP-L-fucose synthase [Desulfonauticus submarinus]SDN44736.1 GDP-L-fucose synthase [Desulfonauticus submarinus]
MHKNSKIYIAGHKGMVGSAIWRALKDKGYSNLIGFPSSKLDLTNQKQVEDFFLTYKPEYVFLAAAKVGGILANATYPAQFIYTNIAIATNVIHAAHKTKVKKLLFLGSSCIYPRECPQPIKEEYLLTSSLEPTNEAYAIAKIAGLKMCEFYFKEYKDNFFAVMPTNLYGPNDNFHLETSHVLPAMLRKFHEAKINNKQHVTLWGTGRPKREFLHVDDLAEACIFLMNLKQDFPRLLNIGCGQDLSIKELAYKIKTIIGYNGEIIWDTSKPDGTPRKLLDISKIKKLGWQPKIKLDKGISSTYKWFVANYNNIKE